MIAGNKLDLASSHREVQIEDVSDWVYCELPKLRYIISLISILVHFIFLFSFLFHCCYPLSQPLHPSRRCLTLFNLLPLPSTHLSPYQWLDLSPIRALVLAIKLVLCVGLSVVHLSVGFHFHSSNHHVCAIPSAFGPFALAYTWPRVCALSMWVCALSIIDFLLNINLI